MIGIVAAGESRQIDGHRVGRCVCVYREEGQLVTISKTAVAPACLQGNEDVGRFGVTGNEAEKFFFKVPSLRNVTQTAPYLHDGSVEDLETLVPMMAEYQLGKQLSAEQTRSIITFLEALTGELPSDYIEVPELPPSGPTTPEPDDK